MRRGLAGIEPTPARPNGAGYARLNLENIINLLQELSAGLSGCTTTHSTGVHMSTSQEKRIVELINVYFSSRLQKKIDNQLVLEKSLLILRLFWSREEWLGPKFSKSSFKF